MDLTELQQWLTKLTESEEFKTLETYRNELINFQLEGFDHFVKFKNESYCSNTVFRTEKFEIRLLCWKPLQETVKHAHPENGCLMKILEGELFEEKYLNGNFTKTIYKEGDVGYITASEIHKLKNSSKNTVSLHIYSPSGFYDNAQ